MAISIRVQTTGSFRAFWERETREMKRAVQAGVAAATEGLKTEIRQNIEAGGLGRRLPNAVRSAVYPRQGESFAAAGEVGAKDPQVALVLDAFERGATVTARGKKWLAIPTEAAGPQAARRGQRRLDPAEWTRRTGIPLRFVAPAASRRAALLVADNVRVTGRGRAARNEGRRKGSGAFTRVQGRATAIVFILVRQARLKRRIQPAAIAERWSDLIPDLIDRALPA